MSNYDSWKTDPEYGFSASSIAIAERDSDIDTAKKAIEKKDEAIDGILDFLIGWEVKDCFDANARVEYDKIVAELKAARRA